MIWELNLLCQVSIRQWTRIPRNYTRWHSLEKSVVSRFPNWRVLKLANSFDKSFFINVAIKKVKHVLVEQISI